MTFTKLCVCECNYTLEYVDVVAGYDHFEINIAHEKEIPGSSRPVLALLPASLSECASRPDSMLLFSTENTGNVVSKLSGTVFSNWHACVCCCSLMHFLNSRRAAAERWRHCRPRCLLS